MRKFADEGVQGGDLRTDMGRWTPIETDEDETHRREAADPGLNPEAALIAKEEGGSEEPDDLVVQPGDNSEFDPEEDEEK